MLFASMFLYGLAAGFALFRLRRGPDATGPAARALARAMMALSFALAGALLGWAAWLAASA